MCNAQIRKKKEITYFHGSAACFVAYFENKSSASMRFLTSSRFSSADPEMWEECLS